MTADEVLNALKEAGIIKSTEIKPAIGHEYGTSYTCRDCGQLPLHCACADNKIIKTIRELEDREKR